MSQKNLRILKTVLIVLSAFLLFFGIFLINGKGLRAAAIIAAFPAGLTAIIGIYVLSDMDLRETQNQERAAALADEWMEENKQQKEMQRAEEVSTEGMQTSYALLAQIGELRDKGLLTEEEFQTEKKKILNGITRTSSGTPTHVQPEPYHQTPQPYYQAPQPQQPIIIQNTNINNNEISCARNKWVAFLLCFFLGFVGAHKFYERKYLLGFFYIISLGFCGVGIIVDLIGILFKPNPYYC